MDYSRRQPLPSRKSSNSKGKENILIPILFTAGAVGWLFFAVDHFVGKSTANVIEETNFNNVKRSPAEHKEWFSGLKAWLNTKLDETEAENTQRRLRFPKDMNKQNIHSKEDSYSNVGNIESLEEQEQQKEELKITSEEGGESQTQDIQDKTVQLYFYKSSSSQLDLQKVVRTFIVDNNKSKYYLAIHALLQGPTAQERLNQDLLDSFPIKPHLLSVVYKNNTLIINVDKSFYDQMSYQMILYQLKQLLKTAKQFEGVTNIQIAINGNIIREIEGEGVSLPRYIDDNFLKTAYNY